MQKQRVVLIAVVALLLVAAGIKIGTATKPEMPRAEGALPSSAASSLAKEADAAAKRQAEEDAKFWAQKERVSSHVTIEHTKEEEEAARRQQKSLLNTVRAAEGTPESQRR